MIIELVFILGIFLLGYLTGWAHKADWEHDKKIIKKIGFLQALRNTIL